MEIPSAVLSDADGTLVNTLELIRRGQYETSRLYLTLAGLDSEEIPDFETYTAMLNKSVGKSAHHTLETTVRLLFQNQPQKLEIVNFDDLHELLDPMQDNMASELIRPYEGLSNLFNHLGDAGIKLAIFTSGTPHHVVRNFGIGLPELRLQGLFRDSDTADKEKLGIFERTVVELYGLKGFTVVTSDDTKTHKPNPEGLNLAMRRLDVASRDSLVLGDHAVDMQSGVNAKVSQRVGITHGFDDRDVLVSAGATMVVDSLDELSTQLVK